METAQKLQDSKNSEKHKVHITAVYTSTGADAPFVTTLTEVLRDAVALAYDRLKEAARPGDTYFAVVSGGARVALAQYLDLTLAQLRENGLGVQQDGEKATLLLDIDTKPGGA